MMKYQCLTSCEDAIRTAFIRQSVDIHCCFHQSSDVMIIPIIREGSLEFIVSENYIALPVHLKKLRYYVEWNA